MGKDSSDPCLRLSWLANTSCSASLEHDTIYCRFIRSKVIRRIVAIIIFIGGTFLVVSPFFVKPEIQEVEKKGRHR